MNRRELVAERFEAMFGYSLDEGERRLRVLLSRAINMDRFTGDFDPSAFTTSKVSMSERDFALIAFFCLAGVGALNELGIEIDADPDEGVLIIDLHPQDPKIKREKLEELRETLRALKPGGPPDDTA